MTDIVARLRDYDSREHPDNVRAAAAAEIERLRAALRLIYVSPNNLGLPIAWDVALRVLRDGWDVRHCSICRAALREAGIPPTETRARPGADGAPVAATAHGGAVVPHEGEAASTGIPGPPP
jgi:hypothetical protein